MFYWLHNVIVFIDYFFEMLGFLKFLLIQLNFESYTIKFWIFLYILRVLLESWREEWKNRFFIFFINYMGVYIKSLVYTIGNLPNQFTIIGNLPNQFTTYKWSIYLHTITLSFKLDNRC